LASAADPPLYSPALVPPFLIPFLLLLPSLFPFFFFNDTAPTEIYTLSLHDALPIWRRDDRRSPDRFPTGSGGHTVVGQRLEGCRSEEHTSELQSLTKLVCRLLLEKKKKKKKEQREQRDVDCRRRDATPDTVGYRSYD